MPNGFDLLCEDNLIDVLDCLLGPSIRDLGFTNKNMYERMKSQRAMEHLIRRLYKQIKYLVIKPDMAASCQ